MKKIFLVCLFLICAGCKTENPYYDSQEFFQDAHPHARTDSGRTQYNYGMRYLLSGDNERAFSYFHQSANAGNPYAANELGYMYAAGKGVPQDYKKSLEWYQRAAEEGVASAQYNLGLMYANGLGTPVDKAQANEWFRRAAAAGFAPATRATAQ